MLGGSPRHLGDLVAQTGVWSPDCKSTAYSNGTNLFTAKADGTDARKITTVADAGFIFNLVWPPDGDHLRFAYKRDAGDPSGYFMEVSPDGTGLHRLLPGWSKQSEDECCGSWTADG